MASACNAQLTDDEFEVALSNAMQHFRHISGLKRDQKLCLETVAQKRDVFGILPTGFRKSLIFQLLPRRSTERLVETRPCLCFSCDAFSFHN